MFNVGRLTRDLAPIFQQISDKDMKFLANVVVSRVSIPVQKDLQKEVNASINAPTPWIQRAVYRRQVGKGDNFAYEVYLPDEGGKGGVPADVLGPSIYGGTRGFKKSEGALLHAGVLGAGLYAYPGIGAQRDIYGNMARSQTNQVLSYLQAFDRYAGDSRNMSDKRKASLAKGSKRKGTRGIAYFVSVGVGKGGRFNRKHHLPAGVWQRTSFGELGSAIKPILIFGKKPTYQKRIKFFETIDATLNREIGPTTDAAMLDLVTKWAGKGT